MCRRSVLIPILTITACGRSAPIAVAPAPTCVLVPGDTPMPAVVRIALPERAELPARVPIPRTRAEQVIYAQLYETLVRVSCDGRPLPGLAESWTITESGRRWTYTLRQGARFWDGSPVRAADVVAQWTSLAAVAGGPLGVARSATALDERRVSVLAGVSGADVARTLASPEMAIARSLRGVAFPLGTGRYRPVDGATTAVTLERADAAGPPPRRLEFRHAGDDARDLLDLGVDLLITDDPVTLDYAAAKPEFAVVPLPWDRAYGLRIPGAAVGPPANVPPPGFRESLARDAVRIEARAALSPVSCGGEPPSPERRQRNAAILFQQDDRTAQALAERLVVVAQTAAGGWLRDLLGTAAFRSPPSATGVTDDEFWDAVSRGEDAGYIVPAAARAPSCGGDLAAAPGVELPLIETRRHAAVRRGVTGFVADEDGTVRLRSPR